MHLFFLNLDFLLIPLDSSVILSLALFELLLCEHELLLNERLLLFKVDVLGVKFIFLLLQTLLYVIELCLLFKLLSFKLLLHLI